MTGDASTTASAIAAEVGIITDAKPDTLKAAGLLPTNTRVAGTGAQVQPKADTSTSVAELASGAAIRAAAADTATQQKLKTEAASSASATTTLVIAHAPLTVVPACKSRAVVVSGPDMVGYYACAYAQPCIRTRAYIRS